MKKVFRVILFIGAFFVGYSLFAVIFFMWAPVPVTPLMVIRCGEQLAGGKHLKLKHEWVSGKKISNNLRLAVICSEDQNFVNHHGFDLEAIDKAVKESQSGRRRLRGASTISQQTAKNVFLWPGRTWVRKGLEAWFTALIELFWSKERIIQVYLNSIEMGDGIYGAEAASGIYFRTTADKLSARQAATLAAILPNPRKYNAASPGPYVSGRIGWILGQMQQYGPLDLK
jgi:monofunctional biosynthetic peptidoglycan transglycosylase